ncbi:hypothetical protein MYP_3259 [Sporocytophaga myxococcoides]|uniref:Uncharacterized protein n=1 Tax=Sporocytophaga myxococcoides TaxID=153721 RepID=A0A098LGD9_9BACT|nr:toxin-antitoxin system YwqK family antitoxin [Sporocytophaga myxococcoides]GAL86030.1 hypothetical protein MYP_3259 [Sporocytophaga myxococcoides]
MFKFLVSFTLLLKLVLLSGNAIGQISNDTLYFNRTQKIKSITQREGNTKRIVKFHENGNKAEEYTLVNDTLEGVQKQWHTTGNLSSDKNYYKGLLNGVCRNYSPSGVLLYEGNYAIITRNNKAVSVMNGFQKEFYPSGKAYRFTHYKENKQDGPKTEWYESGIKKELRNYSNGHQYGKSTAWYESAKLKYTGSFDTIISKTNKNAPANSVKSGKWKTYYKTGERESVRFYKRGMKSGLHEEWFENGQNKSKINYKDDLKYGSNYEWYSNGKLHFKYSIYSTYDSTSKKVISHYKGAYEEYEESGMPVKTCTYNKSGQLNGKWLKYNKGSLEEAADYKNGLKVNANKLYHPNGMVKSERSFVISKTGNRDTSFAQGPFKEYYPDGKIYKEGHYVNDKIEGITTTYNPNGGLQRETFSLNKNTSVLRDYFENGKLRMEADLFIDSSTSDIKASIVPTKYYSREGKLLKRISTYKGKEQGPSAEWDLEGNLRAESCIFQEYHNRVSSWNSFYYSNGQLMKEYYSSSRGFYGPLIEWYIDGKLKRISEIPLYEVSWLQSGEVANVSFFSPHNQNEVKDTIIDKRWVESLYKKFSNPKVKSLRIEGTEDGYVASYYDDKQVKFETYLKNGKPDSIFRGYYPDGRLMVEQMLKEGILNGKYTLMTTNGKIRGSGYYKMGVPYGKWIFNSQSGLPSEEFEFDSKDETHKKYIYKKEFHENGTLKSYSNYENGDPSGIQRTWHPNGQLASEYVIKDKKAYGQSQYYYSNGTASRKAFYENGKIQGLEETWYDNGNKERSQQYIDGKRNGPYKFWYKDGKLRVSGIFLNDLADSLWVYYDSTGNFDYELTYEKGIKKLPELNEPCACIEKEYYPGYEQRIVSLLEDQDISIWEFPFHESLKKYLPSIYSSNLHANPSPFEKSSRYSMTLTCDESIEIGLPDKNGVKLVFNPCYRKGWVGKLDLSAFIFSKRPQQTGISLKSEVMAFKFNKALLVSQSKDLDALAYFSLKYLGYNKQGISIEEPKAVCFIPSRIGSTDVSVTLDDFHPLILVSPQGKNRNFDYESSIRLYDDLKVITSNNETFAGIINGKGKVSFSYDGSKLNLPVNECIIGKNFIAGTLTIDNNLKQEDSIELTSEKGIIKTSQKSLIRHLTDQGFKVAVNVLEEGNKNLLIIKFVYIQ